MQVNIFIEQDVLLFERNFGLENLNLVNTFRSSIPLCAQVASKHKEVLPIVSTIMQTLEYEINFKLSRRLSSMGYNPNDYSLGVCCVYCSNLDRFDCTLYRRSSKDPYQIEKFELFQKQVAH